MSYKFNRELSFSSTQIGGSSTAFNRAQRVSTAYMTSRLISNTTPGVQSRRNNSSSFGDAPQMLCELCNAIPLVCFRDINLRINNGDAMNEYLTVQFCLPEKKIKISFVIQNPDADEPDVMMLASVQGEGFIFRSRSVNAIIRWLSQQFEYVHVAPPGDDMTIAA
jgi:hypothetical protein